MNSAILHVCQHRYPYFRFGYSKQTIFSENDPARDKLQCVTGNYPKTRFSRWVEIEGKASCNLYYSVAPLINRKKIYCQIGFSLPMTDIYISFILRHDSVTAFFSSKNSIKKRWAIFPLAVRLIYIWCAILPLFWLMNKNIIKLILKNWLICSAFNGTETGMNIDIRMQLINKIHLHCFFRNFKNIYL